MSGGETKKEPDTHVDSFRQVISDAGSTPAASTTYKRQTRLSGVILRVDGISFPPLFLKGLRPFHIFPEHLFTPSILPNPPGILSLFGP